MKKVRTELELAIVDLRRTFMTIGSFSFFINLMMLTAPLYMMQLYDRVLASRNESTLIALTLIAVMMLVIMGTLEMIRSRVLVRVGAKLDQRMSARIFSATFTRSLGVAEVDRGMALRDLDVLRTFLTSSAPFALFDAPWAPVFLILIFIFHPLLGVIALIGAIILFGLAVANELRTRPRLDEAMRHANEANVFAQSSLRNAEVIQAMGMLPALQQRWRQRHEKALALQAEASDRGGTITSASKSFRMILQVAMLGTGALLAIEQIITPGVMMASSIIMARALSPVEQAIGNWRGIVTARQAYGRLQELLTGLPQEGEHMRLPDPEGKVSAERLVGVPPGAQVAVIKGISFEIEAGEAVGVIGPTGAGKSTLARLLVGIWKPYGGNLRLDGADLNNWDMEELGRFIGYLPQDVELFAGTVSENISRFGEEPDSADIVAAARLAGIHDMVLRLPNGYDTMIGESGRRLSGGQRQRIALARAVYGLPSLVVLDEPNSNLDAEGDKALGEAIKALKQMGKTVIVMAHRPSAIAAVDKLIMLRDGQIELFGDKDEVLQKVVERRGGAQPQARIEAGS